MIFKVDKLQIIVVAKNISTCPNCSSVGCLKCVQFHSWFRLHLTRLDTENDRLVMKSLQLYFHMLYYCERFEPWSHFMSRLSMIVRVNERLLAS